MIEIINPIKSNRLRFCCSVDQKDENDVAFEGFYLENMVIIDGNGKEQESIDDFDEETKNQLIGFLASRKVDTQMARIVCQSYSQYYLQRKKNWATKFLDFIL